MHDEVSEDRRRSPVSLLTAGELSARRATWQRRRRRLRAGVAVLVLAVAAAAGAAVLTQAGSGPLASQRNASSSASGPRNAARARRVHPARPGSAARHDSAPSPGDATRKGQPARPLAVAQAQSVKLVLAGTSYVALAGHRRREVALTFDDGPSQYTPALLRVLVAMHAPATFFVIGRQARAYPQLVAAEARAGAEIGDHTETHPPLAALSPQAQAVQISQAAAAIERAGGPSPVLLRPPYGSFNEGTLKVLRAQRLLMVLWSADTKDYARPGARRIVFTAVSGAQPGAIILMHDGGGDRSETVAALPRIITRLRQRGFRLVTVSQLVAADPPPAHQPPPHPLSGAL